MSLFPIIVVWPKSILDRNELLTHCVSDCELSLVLQRYVAQDLDQTE